MDSVRPFSSIANACIFFLLSVLACPATAVVLHNYTIALPIGSSDHGQPGLLCTPTKPLDILTFFLLNYVAHAATVLTRPGERVDDYLVNVIGSLLFPSLGLYRGIEAILCGAIFVRSDDLRKAAKSGALCVVVRGADWRPRNGDLPSNVILKRGQSYEDKHFYEDEVPQQRQGHYRYKEEPVHLVTYSPPYMFNKFGCPVFVHRRIIHGTYILPEGYRFAIVPHDIQFQKAEDPSTSIKPTIEISTTYNIVKALIALAQSAYALTTLYRARGDQINQFGYAAFGLTVAPYAVMSIVNLIGNLCQPEYPSLYMVESSTMDEARRRGGFFKGDVGRVKEETARSVCGCGAAGMEDIDDLHFVTSAVGEVKACFTTSPSVYPAHTNAIEDVTKLPTTSIELTSSSTSSTIQSTRPLLIAPIPENHDYSTTSNDPILLIPTHTPLSLPSPSRRHALSSLSLHRTFLLFRTHTWTPTYFPSSTHTLSTRWRLSKYLLTAVISLSPLLIIGLMSHFQPGSIPPRESSTWRAYTMQWVCFGGVTGLWWVYDQEVKDGLVSARAQMRGWVRVGLYVVSASPAVGGGVVVAQMLGRYGVCVWVGE